MFLGFTIARITEFSDFPLLFALQVKRKAFILHPRSVPLNAALPCGPLCRAKLYVPQLTAGTTYP